ncbi:hypothetical protein H4Q26_000955 [Puccinia striiformis f. sp. tritici PST-130]|nr:hypothetical protein H4Q26_000955 [Puccinia striiformis f. sp. tritici PST-130]
MSLLLPSPRFLGLLRRHLLLPLGSLGASCQDEQNLGLCLLTALPTIGTQGEDVPTNIILITNGQIFWKPNYSPKVFKQLLQSVCPSPELDLPLGPSSKLMESVFGFLKS